MAGGNDVQKDLAIAVRDAARHIAGDLADDDRLFDLIGDARFVLIGEASHGTQDFYEARARITRRLIAERGFTAVACEADWPDAYRVNRFVRGRSADTSPAEALGGFKRFPSWMWRNTIVREFVGWLRAHNDGLPEAARCGFYGLDLYSLYQSIEAVIGYLEGVDAESAARARERYACFEHYHRDSQAYGLAAAYRGAEPCEDAAVQQLVELQSRAMDYARRDGILAEDEYFYAEMNARAARDAERYYRAMFYGSVSSWNLRDRHMADTLDALVQHLGRHGARQKVVVWAHNSHLGDARATEMGRQGELNLGQLVRERHGDASRNIGFSTYSGDVTAASDWDMPPERKRVRPALAGSYEVVFHDAGTPRFWLDLRSGGDAVERLREPRLQRAIGVVYRPETEHMSHYVFVELPAQFDALIHLDETRALEPLERTRVWEAGAAPETFPAGV